MSVPTFPAATEAVHHEGLLDGCRGARIFWQRYTPPAARALVGVVHGGGDHSGRYAGITTALVRAGCDVALVDLRGHGRSSGRRWYVEDFGDYAADVEALVAMLRSDAAGRPVFVVAHSTGALATALWGLDSGRGIAGVVLSQPYLADATPPPALKTLAARLVGKLVPFLPVPTGFGPKHLTRDPEMQTWTEADPLYIRRTTARFYEEALRAHARIRRDASRFVHPLLVLLGTADRVASAAVARAFFGAAGSVDKELRTYEGFRHELFNELGREGPIGDAVAWITARRHSDADTAAVRSRSRPMTVASQSRREERDPPGSG